MHKKPLKKILIICVSALFLELWLVFLKGSSIARIIPLVDSILQRHLSAYDSFLIMFLWFFYVMYQYYKITPAVELREFCGLFSDFKRDIGIVVIILLPSHFLIFPLLHRIFAEAIRDIQAAPESIRHVIIVFILPALWLLIISFINKDGNSGPYNASKSVQKQSKKGTEDLPPPPSVVEGQTTTRGNLIPSKKGGQDGEYASSWRKGEWRDANGDATNCKSDANSRHG